MTARTNWQNAMASLEEQTERRESLVAERDQTREQLSQCREAVNRAKISSLKHKFATNTQSQLASLKQTAGHMQSQLSTLAKRKCAVGAGFGFSGIHSRFRTRFNNRLGTTLGD